MNPPVFEDVYARVDNIIATSHSRSPRAIVITPSTGSPFLTKAAESVLAQDFDDICHLIVVDGDQFMQGVQDAIRVLNSDRHRLVALPFNTGKNGMNGHRIYAAFPLLVNAEIIFFLDEDNWWDSDHAGSLVELLESGRQSDWAYAMRKVYTHDEIYVADDNCESIGAYPPFSQVKHGWPSYVDTNCYAFRRNTIAQTAHYWYHPLKADRHFFQQLSRRFPNYVSSGRYSVNYRLKRNGPVSPEYIREGNQYMLAKYGPVLPWSQQD